MTTFTKLFDYADINVVFVLTSCSVHHWSSLRNTPSTDHVYS